MTSSDVPTEKNIDSVLYKYCKTYWNSRNHSVYDGPLPAVLIGQTFEDSAPRIALINMHEKFKTYGRKISLIGIARKDESNNDIKYFYAPFGMAIQEDDRGVYIINNFNTISVMDEQWEIDKLLKDSEELNKKLVISQSRKQSLLDKHRSFKLDTNENLLDDESNEMARQYVLANQFFDKKNDESEESSDLEVPTSRGIFSSALKHSMTRRPTIVVPQKYSINNLLDSMDNIFKQMLLYKSNSKTDVVESYQDLREIFENHIIICGYKDGISYYIKYIRNSTNAPIVIIADEEHQNKIQSLFIKNQNVFHIKGVPTDVNLLGNANVTH